MNRKLTFLLSSIATTGSLTLPLVALAQAGTNPYDKAQTLTNEVGTAAGVGESKSLPVMIGSIINIMLGFLGILLLVYMLYAGFLWMTSGGSEDGVKKAKTMLKNAIIGLVIIVAAFAISNFVLTNILQAVAN